MQRKIKPLAFPFYPLLVGIYAVLFLWSVNVGQVIAAVTVRSLLVSVGLSLVVYLACFALLRNWHKAALVAGWLLAILYLYGQFFGLLDGKSLGGFAIGRHRFFIPLLAVLSAAYIYYVARSRRRFEALSGALNFFVLAMIVVTAVPIIQYEIRYGSHLYSDKGAKSQVTAPSKNLPDVYYIILDGYARSDELADEYHYDNQYFIDGLKKLGFYIPECAYSNYVTTTPSLSSSMNMQYLETMGVTEKATTDSFDPSLTPLMIQSKVRQEFERMGYKIAAFRGYLLAQDWRDADYYFNYEEQAKHVNLIATHNFERLYLRTSLLRPLVEQNEAHQDSLSYLPRWLQKAMDFRPDLYTVTDQEWLLQSQYAFDVLPTIPSLPGKKFVYAHFYSTHEPYVFDKDGNYTPASQHYSEQGYAPAVAYTSQRILAIVSTLIQQSEVRPVIIIQADHGTHNGLSRNKILNAYYFPDQDYARLYSTITPVNTFRVVLDQFFQRSFPLLPDTLLVKNAAEDGKITVQHLPASCDLR